MLSCVYETAAQRLLRVEIRGKSSATDVESADYGKGLLENLMQLLDNAGTSRYRSRCSFLRIVYAASLQSA